MKQKLINFAYGIGTIFLYLILTYLAHLLLQDYFFSKNFIVATLSQIATYLIIFAGLFIFYHKRLIADFKSFKKEYTNIAFKNWIMGLGIMMISNIIITSFVGSIAVNESANRSLSASYPISSVFSMVFIGPLIEEIVFRLSFKEAFSKWYTFAIFTSILFGLAHIAKFKLIEFLFVIPYGALGFFFAKSLYETNNVYTSYLAHFCHNALCIILILLF